MDPELDGGAPPVCARCDAVLVMTPGQAGKHVAVRLDCPEHGPQLMWTPFTDDKQSPDQGAVM